MVGGGSVVARVATAAGVAGARGSIFLSVARAFGDIGLKEPDPVVRHCPTSCNLSCIGVAFILSCLSSFACPSEKDCRRIRQI